MTIPIVEIPENIQELCEPYSPLFSKPQYKQFERFISGLMICDEANIESLSEGYRLSQSYDRLHHFVSESPWDINTVLEQSVTVIKSLPQDRSFSTDGILIIDDTLIEKYGKYIEGVGKLYDHSQSRYIEYAHCLVTLMYSTHKDVRYPLKFELYRKKAECDEAGIEFQTKIALAKQLVSWAVEQGIPFQTVVCDSWFFTKEFVDYIESLEKDWISMCKSNRILTYHGKHNSVAAYAEDLDPTTLPRVTINNKTYAVNSITVPLPSLKRGNQRIRLLVSYEQKKDGSFKTPVYMVSNRKDHRPQRLIRTYAVRWRIETFFRDSKGELGLQDYQMRKLKGIKSHWCLVFTSAVLLELVRSKEYSQNGLNNADLSVGALRQRAWGRSLKAIIQWIVALHDTGLDVQQIQIKMAI